MSFLRELSQKQNLFFWDFKNAKTLCFFLLNPDLNHKITYYFDKKGVPFYQISLGTSYSPCKATTSMFA